MASAAESSAAGGDKPAPKSRKKLFILIGVACVLLIGGAVAALLLRGGSVGGTTPKVAEPVEPIYLPLESFTVNLLDPDVERYALIGLTLELRDKKDLDRFKRLMPALRSQFLLVMSRKTPSELLAPDGKRVLARELQRSAAAVLTPSTPSTPYPPASPASPASPDEGDDAEGPVSAVHFSSFIIQ